jgi:hypothetical protein
MTDPAAFVEHALAAARGRKEGERRRRRRNSFPGQCPLLLTFTRFICFRGEAFGRRRLLDLGQCPHMRRTSVLDVDDDGVTNRTGCGFRKICFPSS